MMKKLLTAKTARLVALLFFITAPLYSATENIRVFFTNPEAPVYADRAKSDIANPDIGMDDALAEFIGTAQSGQTVYLAFHSTTTQKITNAIIEADTNTGGQVYHIMHKAYGTGYSFLGGRSINNASAPGDARMHHKYAVVIDTTAEYGRLWTGSYNPNEFGTFNSSQNSIWIESYDLSKAFADEFLYMWNDGAGRFSNHKVDSQNSAQTAVVDGKNITVYFSPYNSPSSIFGPVVIEKLINEAESSILFNMYTFTTGAEIEGIIDALVRAQERGLKVAGVIDNYDVLGAAYHRLLNEGIDVHLNGFPGTSEFRYNAQMHHKFAVIDHGTPEAVVITGSPNWTETAFTDSDEDMLVIRSPIVAELYWQEFQKNYSIASGSLLLRDEPAIDNLFVYPSPAKYTEEVRIAYTLSQAVLEVEAKIYTLSGGEVITFSPTFYTGADNEISWDLKNSSGNNVAPGLYLVRVEVRTGDGNVSEEERFAVIR